MLDTPGTASEDAAFTAIQQEIARIRRSNRFCIDCGARTQLEFRRGAMVGESRWICLDPRRGAARRAKTKGKPR